jgi:hypothetical protein
MYWTVSADAVVLYTRSVFVLYCDCQTGGVYWYHPHSHGSVTLQMSGGAAGMYIHYIYIYISLYICTVCTKYATSVHAAIHCTAFARMLNT